MITRCEYRMVHLFDISENCISSIRALISNNLTACFIKLHTLDLRSNNVEHLPDDLWKVISPEAIEFIYVFHAPDKIHIFISDDLFSILRCLGWGWVKFLIKLAQRVFHIMK